MANTLPIAQGDTASVEEDSTDNEIAVLANDSVAPDTSEVLQVYTLSDPPHGTASIISDTLVHYTPDADFFGVEVLTYTVIDSHGGINSALITVTVNNLNDTPVLTDDLVSVAEDSVANVLDVLANDTTAPDPGETLRITAVGTVPNGTTGVLSDTLILYTPETYFAGVEVFTYTVSDGNGGYNTALVTVTVTNTALTARPVASDRAAGDTFGQVVALSGDTLVIGAPGDDAQGTDAGAVYVFARNQGGADIWGQVAKLTAADGAAGAGFGTAVALSGDTVVVGAPGNNAQGTNAGAAYVFARNQSGADTWGQVAKLTAADGAAGDGFGTAVALHDDTVVVGVPGNDAGGTDAGAAYVFARNQGGADTWGQVAKLTSGAAGDAFGTAVAVDGDTALVGASGADTGAAYVFKRNQGGADAWGQVKQLSAADGTAGDQFGSAVALNGDIGIVGAVGNDAQGTDAGAAYVFVRHQGGTEAWGQVQKLTAGAGAPQDHFGATVALNGDTVVVGASGTDAQAPNAGAAYVFRRAPNQAYAWAQTHILTALDGADDDALGTAVAVSGPTVVVGAPGYDNRGLGAGTAYVFPELTGDSWLQRNKLTASDGADYDYFGAVVAVSGDTIVIGTPRKYDGDRRYAGAVYIFERNHGGVGAWGQTLKMVGPAAYARFGGAMVIHGDTLVVDASQAVYIFERHQGGPNAWGQVTQLPINASAVALNDDTLVLGDPLDDGVATNAGAVYIFGRNQGGTDAWGQVATINVTDGADSDYFGSAVALSGDTLVVGAKGDDDQGDQSGSVYVFKRNQGGAEAWGQVAKFTASDSKASYYFGSVLALNGDTLVVGVTNATPNGAAYVFGRNYGGADAWGQVAKLTAADGVENDNFGNTVAARGDTVFVGAYQQGDINDPAPDIGAVYVFRRNQGGADTWGQAAKLIATDSEAYDGFGTTVAVNEDTLVIGVGTDNDQAPSAGSAYVYHWDYLPFDLSLSQWAEPDPVAAGATVTYHLHIHNHSVISASNIIVTDTLPLAVVYHSAEADSGSCTANQGTVVCALGTLAPYSSTTARIVATTAPTQTGWLNNTAVVNAQETDLNPANNTAQVSVQVLQLGPEVRVDQWDYPNPVALNTALAYEVSITNDGLSTATDVVLTDTLPLSVTFASASASQGTCTRVGHTVQCALGDLSAGGGQAHVTVAVTPTTSGWITNTVVAAAREADLDEANNLTQVKTYILAADGGLRGTVTAAQTGAALAGIEVCADPLDGQLWRGCATTDATGAYQVNALAAGQYKVKFYDPAGDYRLAYYAAQTTWRTANPVTVHESLVTPDVNAALHASVHITGTVTGANGAPLSKITVEVQRYDPARDSWGGAGQATTDANGAYDVGGLSNGIYRVAFFDWNGGYVDEYYDNALDARDALSLTLITTTLQQNVNAVLDVGNHITGTVTANGAPLEGMSVEVYHSTDQGWAWAGEAWTDAQGHYDIGGLRGDTYHRVRFSDAANQYFTQYYTGTSVWDQATNVYVYADSTTPAINADLVAGGHIAGTVTTPDGNRLPGISIGIYRYENGALHSAGWGKTDNQGHYDIGGLATGTYRVYVAATADYASEYYNDAADPFGASDVNVTAGQTTAGINMRLNNHASPAAEVSGGSVGVDAQTGLVTISVVEWQRSPVTITKEVTCTAGAPTSVTLWMDTASYTMLAAGAGRYTAVIPADAVQNAALRVSKVCSGHLQEELVGQLELYDPSGYIVDATTGAPLPGATVTLYQVPGWRARLGAGDNGPNTCQSNVSKPFADPWSQPAPTHLGLPADPKSGQLDPTVNPLTTDAAGYHGWDVAAGCWYVVVEQEGYATLTSPVVGVPPEVTDLDLALSSLLRQPQVPPTPRAGVAFTPHHTTSAQPGEVVTFTHTLTNTGDADDTFALTLSGWGSLLTTTPLQLTAGGTTTVQIRVAVPLDAQIGNRNTTRITATSQLSPTVYATVQDTITVQTPTPEGLAFAPDHHAQAQPGEVVTFTHTLTNTGDTDDTFALTLSGWGSLLTTSPLQLSPGGAAAVQVRIAVPATAISGTLHTTHITATSQLSPAVYATVQDTISIYTTGIQPYRLFLPVVIRK